MRPKIFTGHVYIKEDNSTFSKFLLLKNEKNNNKQVQYKKAISNITVFFQTLNTINVPTINKCFLHIVFISFLTFYEKNV